MGCPKLAYWSGAEIPNLRDSLEKQTHLKCVWKSHEQSKTRVRVLDYGFRMYDPQLGRWHCIDQLSEKYYSLSNYAYCANNPIKLIDVDGRWFDEKNEKKAERIVNRAERRGEKLDSKAERLEARGKDATDLRARSAELRKVGQDIAAMGQSSTEFRWVNANNSSNPAGVGAPTIAETGTDPKTGATNQVTMYVEGTMGSKIHESRHGGDAARGTLDVSPNSTNYGVQDEVSAYKAQYSYDGKLTYRSYLSGNTLMQTLSAGLSIQEVNNRLTQTITNINQITPSVINSIADGVYPTQVIVYPMQFSNPQQWNNN